MGSRPRGRRRAAVRRGFRARSRGCPISLSCCWAMACWVKRVAWIPWKRPSSQPTSWACAMRSSDSLGVSEVNGRTTSSSSFWSSGDSTPSSSRSDFSWISRRARRPASSSGAADLFEHPPHHRGDADELRRPGDLLARRRVDRGATVGRGGIRRDHLGHHGVAVRVGHGVQRTGCSGRRSEFRRSSRRCPGAVGPRHRPIRGRARRGTGTARGHGPAGRPSTHPCGRW